MRNLIPHFIAEKFQNNQTCGSFMANTMFLDISGFTSMTERLMQEGKEGAEVLSEIINNIFEPVIETVYSAGGVITSFAGDAFTAVFPNLKQSAQVALCAVDIGWIFEKKGTLQTKFGEFNLFVKIGLSSGEVEWAIIGNPKQQTYYFKGEAIDGCAQSQHLCGKSDILYDENFHNILPKNIRTPKQCLYNGFYRLINCEYASGQESLINEITIPREILEKFIPDQVLELEQHGEFREIVTVFISCNETVNAGDLNRVIIETIDSCSQYGGYFNQSLFGDKGTVMLACFGMPKSYENNLVRALDFVLDLQKKLGDTIRIGLNAGIAYAGFIGSSLISEYTSYGDIVNQAARFMAKADWGKIWTTGSVASKMGRLYSFNDLGVMRFKGKMEQIAIFELTGKSENSEMAFFSGEMVGRRPELALLNNLAEPLSKNRFAGLVTVYAEAGMGKSRLVYEFVKVQERVEVLFLQTDSVLRMSLNPFRYLLHNYFNQNNTVSKEVKRRNFEAVFNLLLQILSNSSDSRKLSIVKELERVKSVLAAQIEVFYENSLYEQLDAKSRFENTLFAYKEFFKALSIFKPVIIQIEDIHWLDDDSNKMVQTLCRAVDDYPIMIVATSRFNDDGSKPVVKVDNEVAQTEIVLDKLDTESGKYFMELQLEKPADAELISFVCNKAEYNPFYIEQIVYYLKDNKLLNEKDGRYFLIRKEIAIPNSISAIIIARIDRLESDVKNLLQMASVFGREVELKTFLIMIELYQLKVEQSQLKTMLEKIEDEQLWNKFAEIKYIFKHALLNEAAYEMQLKSRLRDLHKLAAQSLEKLHADEVDKFYEIARHYDKAEMVEETVNYYEKAGDWLKKNYQNAKAIECYDRVLELIGDNDLVKKFEILLNKCEILDIIGEWETKAGTLATNIEIAKRNMNKRYTLIFTNNLASLKLRQSDYVNSIIFSNLAIELAKELNDNAELCSSIHNIGNIYSDQGRPVEALENFELSKNIAEKYGIKDKLSSILGSIGVAYYEKGDFAKALECYSRQIEIQEELGDKQGLSITLNNIGIVYTDQGNYDLGMDFYDRAKSNFELMGDKRNIGMVICNIGNIYFKQGNFSQTLQCYEIFKKNCQDLGNKRHLSLAINNMGFVYEYLNDPVKALECYTQAVDIGKELQTNSTLCEFLYNKASILFVLKDYNKAQVVNEEAMSIAKEVEREDVIFSSTILYHKLLALENPAEAFANLTQMLESETEEENIATIHYEIYKINQSAEHQQQALAIYSEMYATTPDIEYKNRIEELNSSSQF